MAGNNPKISIAAVRKNYWLFLGKRTFHDVWEPVIGNRVLSCIFAVLAWGVSQGVVWKTTGRAKMIEKWDDAWPGLTGVLSIFVLVYVVRLLWFTPKSLLAEAITYGDSELNRSSLEIERLSRRIKELESETPMLSRVGWETTYENGIASFEYFIENLSERIAGNVSAETFLLANDRPHVFKTVMLERLVKQHRVVLSGSLDYKDNDVWLIRIKLQFNDKRSGKEEEWISYAKWKKGAKYLMICSPEEIALLEKSAVLQIPILMHHPKKIMTGSDLDETGMVVTFPDGKAATSTFQTMQPSPNPGKATPLP